MEDKQLSCSDCGQSFVFTAKDQEFFKQNNFSDPKRCKSCRAKKRANQNQKGRRD